MYRYLHQLLEAQNRLRGEPGLSGHTRDTILSKERRQIIVVEGPVLRVLQHVDNHDSGSQAGPGPGGTNARRNLQALCKLCNWQKAAEEAHLLALLRTVAGRAELWRQWTQLRAEQTARSQRKRAQQEAQYGEALRRMEANRQVGRCESPPRLFPKQVNRLGPETSRQQSPCALERHAWRASSSVEQYG